MTTKNDFSLEENYQEKKKLTELIFEKARNDSRETAKTTLANYIDENSSLKFKTSTRMFDRYILGDCKKSIPTMYNLNLAAKFLEFHSFADFCNKNFPENDNALPEENIPISMIEDKGEELADQFNFLQNTSGKKSYLKGGVTGLGIATIIGFSSYLGLNGEDPKDCMYWKDTHYEKVACGEEIHPNVEKELYDEKLYKYFHRIDVTDTTTFFRAGIPIVWYVKIDGEPEFYSADGKHPISGKELKPVTTYIIDKYVVSSLK